MKNREVLGRQLRLLRVLAEHRGGLSSVQLAQRLQTSRPTVDRDLQTLRTYVGIAIGRKRVTGEVRHILEGTPLALAATPIERAALQLAHHALSTLAGTRATAALAELAATQFATTPQVVGPASATDAAAVGHVRVRPPHREPIAPTVLESLERAMQRGRRVRVRVRIAKYGGRPTTYHLDPLAIRLSAADPYLDAWAVERGALRTFKIARIEHVEILREAADEHPEVDLDRLGFTGHRQDPELAWVDMGGRIYDPMTSRFLTPDPVRETFDPFSYALNVPFNRMDPSGFNTTKTQYGPPERPPVIHMIEGGFLERYSAEHEQTQPSGDCDDEGCSTGKQDPGRSTVRVATGNTIVKVSDEEAAEDGPVTPRSYIVAAYDPDDWDEFHEDEAFNEAVSHSAANVVTLGIPSTIETVGAVIDDARAGNVPTIDRYVVAFVEGTTELVRTASSDRVGADRGAARGALVGAGMEFVASAIVGGLANTGPGGPVTRRPGTLAAKEGCFDPSTQVQTSAGPTAIENVQVGDSVLPYVAGCESEWPEEPVALTYVSLDHEDVVVELVGSDRTALLVGDVEYLEAPVLGVSGAFEIVERIRLNDRLADDLGCPVLGRVRRTVDQAFEVVVGEGDREERIVTADSHPFLSADRGEWVPAGDLRVGEQLVSSLTNSRVLELTPVDGREVVNLWVGGSHRYLVGELGLEVHNECWLRRVMRNRGISIPSWMANLRPHGHHIIPKGLNRARSPRLAGVVDKLQDLARQFNIDIVNDMDNLTIAPNGMGTHSVAALDRVHARLAANTGSEAAFRAELRQIGQDISDGSFYLEFSHSSNTFGPAR